MKKTILLLALAAITASCSNRFKYIQTNPKSFTPIDAGAVAVITENSKIPKDHDEVGLIICKSSKEHKAFARAKKKAAAHGANAIYIMNSKDNNILVSRDIDGQEKAYNVERGQDFQSKITFKAIYIKP